LSPQTGARYHNRAAEAEDVLRELESEAGSGQAEGKDMTKEDDHEGRQHVVSEGKLDDGNRGTPGPKMSGGALLHFVRDWF